MCGSAACRKTLRTVTSVVTRARMFTALSRLSTIGLEFRDLLRSLMCGSAAGRKTLRTVTSVVTRARMFTAKPDGDVNIFMLQARRQPCRRTVLECEYAGVPTASAPEGLHRWLLWSPCAVTLSSSGYLT